MAVEIGMLFLSGPKTRRYDLKGVIYSLFVIEAAVLITKSYLNNQSKKSRHLVIAQANMTVFSWILPECGSVIGYTIKYTFEPIVGS